MKRRRAPMNPERNGVQSRWIAWLVRKTRKGNLKLTLIKYLALLVWYFTSLTITGDIYTNKCPPSVSTINPNSLRGSSWLRYVQILQLEDDQSWGWQHHCHNGAGIRPFSSSRLAWRPRDGQCRSIDQSCSPADSGYFHPQNWKIRWIFDVFSFFLWGFSGAFLSFCRAYWPFYFSCILDVFLCFEFE